MADDERKLIGDTVGGSGLDDEFARFLRTPQFSSIVESVYPSLSPSTTVTAVPVGAVLPYAGDTAPDGWLMCDGSTFDTRLYPELSRVIGSSTPDLRGRVPVGVGQDGTAANNQNRALRTTGGDWRMQSHDHSINGIYSSISGLHFHPHTSVVAAGQENYAAAGYTSSDPINHAGSGGAENMPPFYVLNFIIKAR